MKEGKSGRTVKGIYGWWSECHVKIGVQYLWSNNIRNQVQYFLPFVLLLLCALLLTVVDLLCIVLLFCVFFVTACILFYCVCIAVLHTLVAGLLARSNYPEGPATCHLGTGFSWFPCAWKQMMRWFPRLQVASACFSCSPPNFNLSRSLFHIYVRA